MDVTPEVRRYRECARHAWNAYFQPMRDGWHEFPPVDEALFQALVLSQFERRPGLFGKHPDGYHDALAVVPVRLPCGLPVMFMRREGGKEGQWAEARIEGRVDLKFIEFFDFANYDDPRDLRWVRARVLGPQGHELHGADVITEFENVQFEALT